MKTLVHWNEDQFASQKGLMTLKILSQISPIFFFEPRWQRSCKFRNFVTFDLTLSMTNFDGNS